VREPWPSVATGAEIDEGEIGVDSPLAIVSEMNQDGVVFGDGIEDDRLDFAWGLRVAIDLADQRLRLVRG
jgi:hypothetical protein